MCHFTRTIELVILEDTLQHFAFNGNSPCLPIEVMVLEVALAELFLVDVVSEAIKLVKAVFVYHLSCES